MTEKRIKILKKLGKRHIQYHLHCCIETEENLFAKYSMNDEETAFIKGYINELIDGFQWELEEMLE